MNGNRKRRFDADLHHIAAHAQDADNDFAIDDNVLILFAGENEHRKARNGARTVPPANSRNSACGGARESAERRLWPKICWFPTHPYMNGNRMKLLWPLIIKGSRDWWRH